VEVDFTKKPLFRGVTSILVELKQKNNIFQQKYSQQTRHIVTGVQKFPYPCNQKRLKQERTITPLLLWL
jgi:hypothetical protein